MPLKIETLTVVEIGGHEFYLRTDAALPKDTIVVRDTDEIARLGHALDLHAMQLQATPEPPVRLHKSKGDFAKVGTLGGTREQLLAALKTPAGSNLTPQQRTILDLACNGHSIENIARSLHLTVSTTTQIRREAARALGFTPKNYPQYQKRRATGA